MRSILLLAAALAFARVAFAVPAEFTFASWNIGHYALGKAASSTVPEAEAAKRSADYRAFLDEVGADVLGVAEYSADFTCDGATRADRAVFGRYGRRVVGPCHAYQWNALFWNGCGFVATRTVEYPQHDQRVYYVATRLKVADVEVVFVETHLDWRTFLPGHENDRKLQLAKLVEDFRDEPRVVIAGDFNVGIRTAAGKTADDPSEYAVFSAAGYALGNDGRHKTCPAGRLDASAYALDNVIVKGLDILEFRVFDRPDLSDHALVRARLRLRDGGDGGLSLRDRL